MFIDYSRLLLNNPIQMNYGVAVTDVDGDGMLEVFIAGFGFPNMVLKWRGDHYADVADIDLADSQRQAIGVAAADIDGDGREEIYVLNTDTFAGRKAFADRLFDSADDHWTDLFSLAMNQHVLNLTAGRSVAAVDRAGQGMYGFLVANYGGPLRLYELDDDGYLRDAAPDAGLALVTGGRSLLTLPLVSPRMDIFCGNEGGENFLFRALPDGTYEETAAAYGIDDPHYAARGVAALDANDDGMFDLVCGNWEGPNRLYIQLPSGRFQDIAPVEMARPARTRTVLAADFDNDGNLEIFFNNIGQPNRLFGLRRGQWVTLPIGDALEPTGLGTGAAFGDVDGDGVLELFITHGESGVQPLSLYKAVPTEHHWLRVLPLTPHGAPARGAVVTLETPGRTQRRVIDAGSGYLCQMEPVAHFGLGHASIVNRVMVRWLDGKTAHIHEPPIDQLLRVPHPG